MKLASASSAFHLEIERGDLTQLEFLTMSARKLAVDGVVLDVRHFPRTDDDYLAQIKKLATDLGLTIAAVQDDAFFLADEAGMQGTLQIALAVGAPLISAPLAAETAIPWASQLSRLAAATGLAKAANVTLALRDRPGTFAASVHDFKRASKEADSAWLRYGPGIALLDNGESDDREKFLGKLVLVWAETSEASAAAAKLPAYRGFLVVRPH